MRRKKFKKLLHLSTFLLIMVTLLLITEASGSFRVNSIESNRGVSARIVSHQKGFVGIKYHDLYSIILPEDGRNTTISIFVTNNLHQRADYELDLSGRAIENFNPSKFTLGPNESEEIVIILLNIEKAMEGYSKVIGNILAKFNDGSIDVDFEFGVDIQLPEITIEDIEDIEDKPDQGKLSDTNDLLQLVGETQGISSDKLEEENLQDLLENMVKGSVNEGDEVNSRIKKDNSISDNRSDQAKDSTSEIEEDNIQDLLENTTKELVNKENEEANSTSGAEEVSIEIEDCKGDNDKTK